MYNYWGYVSYKLFVEKSKVRDSATTVYQLNP